MENRKQHYDFSIIFDEMEKYNKEAKETGWDLSHDMGEIYEFSAICRELAEIREQQEQHLIHHTFS